MFHNEQNFTFDFKQFFSPLTTRKAILILVVIGFIVFANCLFNGFVLDDNAYIVRNPADIAHIDLERLFGFNNFNEYGQYRPISAFYYAAIYHFFGIQTFFYHILQVALHIVNAILFYFLLKQFFKKGSSLVLSILFLIHPMNVESVSWISGALSILFFLFGMLALALSVKNSIQFPRLLLIVVLLLLSLLSKEPGVFFVFLIPFLRILYYKKQQVVLFISSVVVILIYFAVRFRAIGFTYSNKYLQPIEYLSFPQRVLNIPQIILFYIGTFLFPQNLAERHNWTVLTPNLLHFYLPLFLDSIFFLGTMLMGFYLWKQKREQFKIFIFFFLWFVIGLGMLLQIVPLDGTVADRWMYFPMAGLLGLIGVGVNSISLSRSSIKRAALMTVIFLIGVLSVRTVMRNANFQDQSTILVHDIQVDDDYSKEGDLGYLYLDRGEKEQAYQHFEKSIELNPRAKSVLFQFNWVGNHIQR